jgi:predicted transcriptional regulator
MLPSDGFVLLSVINTKLRDFYDSLESLCYDLDEDIEDIKSKLENIGYIYDENMNQFIKK